MTLVYRSTVGRRLTVSEGDLNIYQLSQSDGVTFVQSGTAPTTRTVEDVERAVVRSGDFASATNYLARLEALTETFGVARLNIQQENGIRFQTSEQPFTLSTHQTTFNGTIDDTLVLGYNVAEGTSGRIDTSEPYLYLSMESDYNNGSAHFMEMNIDYLSSDGLTSKRFLALNVNRSTHAGAWEMTPSLQIGHTGGQNGYILLSSTSGGARNAKIRLAGGSGVLMQIGGDGTVNEVTNVQLGFDITGAATSYVDFSSTGAAFTVPAGGLTVNSKKVPSVIAQSAVAVSGAADTNENTLATITIPAGAIGLNGRVRVRALFTFTNGADDKIVRMRYSGASGAILVGPTFTTDDMCLFEMTIANRNDAASQINAGWAKFGDSGGILSVLDARTTGTVDTTSATTIVLTGQKETAGNTLTLQEYIVELLP